MAVAAKEGVRTVHRPKTFQATRNKRRFAFVRLIYFEIIEAAENGETHENKKYLRFLHF